MDDPMEIATDEPQTTKEFILPESAEEARLRFQLELEFVQCLANPMYLQFLAQRNFMNDRAFINYLSYLRYWHRPEYAKYIVYPYALEILDLLQHREFREALKGTETALFVHQKEFFSWQWYRNRSGLWMKTKEEEEEEERARLQSETKVKEEEVIIKDDGMRL
ncbi:mediator of RNA polymerase II transcription subunit 31-like protein [Cladochytrium replicatum]|nr:mediator of RNA polymerase II transcription subunit 31-like protein [Cladochytrium replicatum]